MLEEQWRATFTNLKYALYWPAQKIWRTFANSFFYYYSLNLQKGKLTALLPKGKKMLWATAHEPAVHCTASSLSKINGYFACIRNKGSKVGTCVTKVEVNIHTYINIYIHCGCIFINIY